jgi:hypothetical protein
MTAPGVRVETMVLLRYKANGNAESTETAGVRVRRVVCVT